MELADLLQTSPRVLALAVLPQVLPGMVAERNQQGLQVLARQVSWRGRCQVLAKPHLNEVDTGGRLPRVRNERQAPPPPSSRPAPPRGVQAGIEPRQMMRDYGHHVVAREFHGGAQNLGNVMAVTEVRRARPQPARAPPLAAGWTAGPSARAAAVPAAAGADRAGLCAFHAHRHVPHRTGDDPAGGRPG